MYNSIQCKLYLFNHIPFNKFLNILYSTLNLYNMLLYQCNKLLITIITMLILLMFLKTIHIKIKLTSLKIIIHNSLIQMLLNNNNLLIMLLNSLRIMLPSNLIQMFLNNNNLKTINLSNLIITHSLLKIKEDH